MGPYPPGDQPIFAVIKSPLPAKLPIF